MLDDPRLRAEGEPHLLEGTVGSKRDGLCLVHVGGFRQTALQLDEVATAVDRQRRERDQSHRRALVLFRTGRRRRRVQFRHMDGRIGKIVSAQFHAQRT